MTLNTCYLILTTFMAILLTIFFLIFTLICAKNIRYGVYAVIFSMPLYLWRFSIFGIPTTTLEIMIYILFLTWALNQTSKQYHSTVYSTICIAIKRKHNLLLVVGITLLFLGLILSTLHSSNLRTSLGICKGWFFDPVLFFIVFINITKKARHIELSLASWVFSGVIVSLISIFYLLNNILTFDNRLSAFYISPNYLAMYLAPVFLIMLFFLNNNLSFPRRRESITTINDNLNIIQNIKKTSNIQYLLFIIILIPLFFTYSYGAFLGVFASTIWLFYKTQICHSKNNILKYTQKKPLLKTLILIILIAFIFITAAKFNQIIDSENRSSFHSRLMIWNVSAEIIKDNPIFGIGPGTFQEVYLSYSEKFDEPYLEWAVTQPHNTFLAFYLQTGLAGFIGFILILIWFFYSGFKRKDNNIQYPISNVLTPLIIYILVHGLVDTMYWKNDLSLMFWLIIGVAIINQQLYQTEK